MFLLSFLLRLVRVRFEMAELLPYLCHALAAFFALTYLQCVAVADTAGCGKTPTLTNGQHVMTVNDKSRRWILRLPR